MQDKENQQRTVGQDNGECENKLLSAKKIIAFRVQYQYELIEDNFIDKIVNKFSHIVLRRKCRV